jgi:hypothetical protein
MYSALDSARECITHPGSKGDASEDCWRKMLRTYLPKRYCVDNAFVIDHEGNESQQIDIVIYDQQYSPFIFHQNNQMFIPAESVYAVIEAKQELSKGMLEYAAEKAASVRRLKRTNGSFGWAKGALTKPRELFPITAGIVALSSTWTPPLGDAFRAVVETLGKDSMTRIDCGCAIDGGAFDTHFPAENDPEITRTGGNMALMTFFLKLLARLQQLGTCPAIEIDKYLGAIEMQAEK